jgi:hypothetical protein
MFIRKLIDLSALNLIKNVNFKIHTTDQIRSGKLWRQQNGLAKLQTAKGPLIDTPDYSFLGKKVSSIYRCLRFF